VENIMSIIPESHKDLLEKPVVAVIATVTPEGKPHNAGIWRWYDGEYVYITCDYGSRKHKNMSANPNVSLLMLDPANPYRYLEVRGTVVEMIEAGALELLNKLSDFYVGKPQYFGQVEPAEKLATYRGVLFKIKPERAVTFG
jgi:PPOX class probable F420-dependent enzyme